MGDTPKSKLKKRYHSLRMSGACIIPGPRRATASYGTLPDDVIREITLLIPK